MRTSVVSRRRLLARVVFVGAVVLCAVVGGISCRRASVPPPATPQLSGVEQIAGLSAPVRVIRDRWGVPHIHAQNQDDLFFAQGFVQAQDRLFQMDLWRRTVRGRLSEVLGLNFVERDAMTRRVQYRGDLDREWASYGPDAKAIAGSFVRGVNAWVTRVRERPTEEFMLAGWLPEVWSPEDLLNRTDAFVASVDASDEVLRSRLAEKHLSAGATDRDLVTPDRDLGTSDLDLSEIGYAVGNAIPLVGTPPFFTQAVSTEHPRFPAVTRIAHFRAADAAAAGDAWVVSGRRSVTGAPLLASTMRDRFDNPSRRYLVHLSAPGWNAIGATAPWLPGIAIGHNDHVAWSYAVAYIDTQDFYVERVNPANDRQVEENGSWEDTRITRERLNVKGRPRSMFAGRVATRHGPVLATDPDRNLAFALRWSGAEPGAAAELAAPALDRAGSADQFRSALDRWKMPSAIFVFTDIDGSIGSQTAALIPERQGRSGALPVPGWDGKHEWRGFRSSDSLPREANPSAGYVTTARDLAARAGPSFASPDAAPFRGVPPAASYRLLTMDEAKRQQRGIVARNAEKLIPLLVRVRSARNDLEVIRAALLGWDKRMTVDSRAATLYSLWESMLLKKLFDRRLGSHLADDYVSTGSAAANLGVAALLAPTTTWFGKEPVTARDRLLLDALGSVADMIKVRDDLAWG
ncbi:MAG TPA: penicillin acylase family protein, partial [Vicinamibacterales bacterium]|nr:penicillin acylase family protein [Vicinamibacterales bacterium]